MNDIFISLNNQLQLPFCRAAVAVFVLQLVVKYQEISARSFQLLSDVPGKKVHA